MDSRLFARILLRLLAIYLIARGIIFLPDLYLIPISGAQFESDGLNSFVWVVISVFAPIIAGIILWLVSPFIASWVVGSDNRNVNAPVMSLGNIQEIIIAIAGLIIVVVAIPEVVNLLIQAFVHSFYNGLHRVFDVGELALLIASILQLLLGLFLFLGARLLGRLLRTVREFGLSNSQ